MNWIELNNSQQLQTIVDISFSKTQLIFKHSTRCSISSVAKMRLDKSVIDNEMDCYYLDLLAFRNISNEVATLFKIEHQSPQVLVIKNGDCIFTESHQAIVPQELEQFA